MMTNPVRLTGAYTASTVADATIERDIMGVLIQRAGIDTDSIQVGGKSKVVEFSATGELGAIDELRRLLSGRAFLFPGLWTRVE